MEKKLCFFCKEIVPLQHFCVGFPKYPEDAEARKRVMELITRYADAQLDEFIRQMSISHPTSHTEDKGSQKSGETVAAKKAYTAEEQKKASIGDFFQFVELVYPFHDILHGLIYCLIIAVLAYFISLFY